MTQIAFDAPTCITSTAYAPTVRQILDGFTSSIAASILDEEAYGPTVRHGDRDVLVVFDRREDGLYAHIARGDKRYTAKRVVWANDVYALLNRLDHGRLGQANLAGCIWN